jgi:hypothetical protein
MKAKPSFQNAKACFAENINDYIPQRNPLKPLQKADAVVWNLSRGLLDLTSAIEARFDELETRLRAVEQVLEHNK